MRRCPADRHACCQFTGDFGTSPTGRLLGAYITGENDGRACARHCGDCGDVEQCDPNRVVGSTDTPERGGLPLVVMKRGNARGAKGAGHRR
jgi:hypothetical protein